MTLTEKIRNLIRRFLGLQELKNNPYGERYTFINDAEEIRRGKLREYKIWYIGDSDELLNLYLHQRYDNFLSNPIYNRNNRQYFWSLSNEVCGIKRIHSGIPHAIVTTLVNAVGNAKITSSDEKLNDELSKIDYENDLTSVINQQQMPLTLAEGYGAFKIDIEKDSNGKNRVYVQFYDGENVELVERRGQIVGVIFKTWFKRDGKDYLLLEVRRIANGNSYIEYSLNKLNDKNEIEQMPLNSFPEFADLEDLVIEGYDKLLAVPSIYFYDTLNGNSGRSIFAGKLDQFDDLDMTLSVASHTLQVSGPIEHIQKTALLKDENGIPIMPNVFNRQFIVDESMPNGDGTHNDEVRITQPQVYMEQYITKTQAIITNLLLGILSPATMGMDLSKKDNADAQREKEKVTIMTRNNIIKRQSRILKDLYTRILDLKQYVNTGAIKQVDYGISVDFDEFANPSFENELEILASAFTTGAISTEEYVDRLYRESKTKEEKQIEIDRLKEIADKNSGNFDLGVDNEGPVNEDLQDKGQIYGGII